MKMLVFKSNNEIKAKFDKHGDKSNVLNLLRTFIALEKQGRDDIQLMKVFRKVTSLIRKTLWF